MKVLANIFLIVSFLGSSLLQGLPGEVRNCCASIQNQVVAAPACASCAEKSCCQKHASRSESKSCCHVSGSDHSSQKTSEKSGQKSDCPCCPGGCCLVVTAPVAICCPFVVEGFISPQVASISLQDDQLTSRTDRPDVPPPKVMLAA